MVRFGVRQFLIAVAALLVLGTAQAEARAGGGSSFGSRGGRTFSAPAPTPTAPRPAAPIQRSMTPEPGPGAPPIASPSPFGGLGRGLMWGLVGGGLIGLLTGGGIGSGLGSIFSLILQIGLIVLLVRFAMGFFARRAAMAGNAQAYARSGPGLMDGGPAAQPGGFGGAGNPGGNGAPLPIGPADYADFERLLGDVQSAFGREDVAALRRIATPEVASNFEGELADNAARGILNKVSGAKLLQGDLSEAWREADADYATVAMRYSLLDTTVDRKSGRIISGDPSKPDEVTELWTFRRPRGGSWQLSAIQQA